MISRHLLTAGPKPTAQSGDGEAFCRASDHGDKNVFKRQQPAAQSLPSFFAAFVQSMILLYLYFSTATFTKHLNYRARTTRLLPIATEPLICSVLKIHYKESEALLEQCPSLQAEAAWLSVSVHRVQQHTSAATGERPSRTASRTRSPSSPRLLTQPSVPPGPVCVCFVIRVARQTSRGPSEIRASKSLNKPSLPIGSV